MPEAAGFGRGQAVRPAKKERKRINLDEESVPRAQSVYVDVGKRAHRLHNYKRAMQFFDAAVELDPDSTAPLESRAATLVQLAHFDEALQEITKLEEALEQVPLGTRRLKVEALWQGGQFERAAVLAARGMRVRRQPPYFTDMYYTSLGTLEQCVGLPAEDCMDELAENTDLLDLLRPDPVEDEIGTAHTTRRHYVKPKTKEELCRAQRYREFLRQRRLYKAQVFLGALGDDIEFIDALAEHPAVVSANKASEARIRRHVDSVNGDMTKRMGHMEEECPLYAVRAKVHVSAALARRRALELREQSGRAEQAARRAIVRVLTMARSGDLRLLFHAVNAARAFFDATSRRVLPDRNDYLALLYHLLGILYLQKALFRLTASEPEARARQAREHVDAILQTGDGRDLVMAGATIPFHDYEGVLRVCEFRLRRARSKLERLCITFEMAHANSKLHRWEQSLNHSRKAFAMARETGHNVWAVVCGIELCKAELHLNTRIEAKTTIREVIELAHMLEDEYLLELLYAIQERLEQPARMQGEHGAALSPQQRILRLMPDAKMRNKCTEMFARINALPPECRLALESRWRDADAAEVTDGTDARHRASSTFFREEAA